jgi:uncharacterized membrane protein
MNGGAARAAVIIGVGMGGVLDLVVFHHILQWHHMISSRLPPVTLGALQENLFWDGIALAVAWIILFVGVLLLANAARSSRSLPTTLPTVTSFLGYVVIGWGIFNLADALFAHHLLELHAIREDVENPMVWNAGFLLIGGVLLPLVGWGLVRAGTREEEWA